VEPNCKKEDNYMERTYRILGVIMENIKKDLQQGRTLTNHQAALATKFRKVAGNIFGFLQLCY